MAQGTLHDGSTGDVVIRSGPPASGGGGGGFGGGGGGGGNRVGASGNFGGPSAKTVALRRQALQQHREKQAREKAEADARAQEQARAQTRQQILAGMAHRHTAFRVEVDRHFAARMEQIKSARKRDIWRAPAVDYSTVPIERWRLHAIETEKNHLDELIARKNAELNHKNHIARSYDGHDPLARTVNDYLARLDQFEDGLAHGHQIWEDAYNAAHESRLLTAQLDVLNRKSLELTLDHAKALKSFEAWERHRKLLEQREARVRFRQKAGEEARIQKVNQANTFSYPMQSSTAAASVLISRGGALVAGASDMLALAVRQSVISLSSAVGTLAGSQVAIFIGGMLYPSELANGELTPEQRSRLLVGFPASTFDQHDSQELQAIADKGGSAETWHRVKPIALEQGAAVVVTQTGGIIDPWVPVVNAVLDPLTGVYIADVPGSPSRRVQFPADFAPQVGGSSEPLLKVTEPQVQAIPRGVDLRIQDCFVCVPGREPVYLSFDVPPMGTGVVTGTGQLATMDWWKNATREQGAAIPNLIGDQFRGREFKSFEDFDKTLWSTLGEHPELVSSFDEVNKKRVEQGYPPVAPKSMWVGENREFELRYEERPEFWSDPFNIDKISIKAPNSAVGWIGLEPAVTPLPMPPASSWKPLVPPGSEQLGSTTTPITPTVPAVYPGNPATPVLPENETLPTVDEGEIGASIPGFPGDMDLPSPDALFRDRRDDPGVATGVGQVVSGIWLGDAARGDGAPIPSQIADQLRGREFANFHRFREAFWRAVAADALLNSQFSATNLRFMRKGTAPFPSKNDQHGARVKFELHHQREIAKGGGVYDMENIVVMTPKQHVLLHKGGDQL